VCFQHIWPPCLRSQVVELSSVLFYSLRAFRANRGLTPCLRSQVVHQVSRWVSKCVSNVSGPLACVARSLSRFFGGFPSVFPTFLRHRLNTRFEAAHRRYGAMAGAAKNALGGSLGACWGPLACVARSLSRFFGGFPSVFPTFLRHRLNTSFEAAHRRYGAMAGAAKNALGGSLGACWGTLACVARSLSFLLCSFIP